TKVGRFLGELCHALTGGFGISFQGVGLGSACAEPEGRSDLFAHLKPEYLKRRPEDFVNPRSIGARPALADAPATDDGSATDGSATAGPATDGPPTAEPATP